MRNRSLTTLLIGAIFLGGCEAPTVPNYNNPSIEDLQSNPTRTGVLTAATGLLVGARNNIASANAYVSLLGILGRESYNFDSAEPRFITEMLIGPMTSGGAFGGNLWTLRYRNIRNANILMGALDQVTGISAAEEQAIRGFAKTMQAHDFLLIINTRHENGAVLDVDRTLDEMNESPAPFVGREEVLSHVSGLLDEAQGHLQQGGASFPFPLSSGFSDFNTPATFLRFNRALKARVEVYRENYAAALTALQGSFLDTSAPLDLGAYHTYASGSGETQNTLSASTIRAHPSVVSDAQSRPGGAVDLRVQEKVTDLDARSQLGLSSSVGFDVYPAADSPVPIITNEELILLRSEARWFTSDMDGATSDLNLIRTRAGGLDEIERPASTAEYVSALLRERRYSLLFEGHRWIDLRRFDRLGELPLDLPTHTVQTSFPIPEAECLARGIDGECGAT
ncbi:MAG: RagB/SusD family nutrient uptake outer membrane protein [Gemmatimonadota bacterium]